MSCAIAVMAKAPRPGHSKTRLSPPLTPDEARDMSAAFLRDITENIREAAQQADIAGYIAYAPAGMEALFDGILAEGTQLLLADGTGEAGDAAAGVEGFGRSLLHATSTPLFARGHSAVCVLNSDSPTLAHRVPRAGRTASLPAARTRSCSARRRMAATTCSA